MPTGSTNKQDLAMENNYFTLSNREWRYKGEGNAHLALSLPKDQLVLRFEKAPEDIPLDDHFYSHKIQLEVDFIKIVMTKLLGKNFVAPPQIIFMKEAEVENLNKVLFSIRPEFRRHKRIGSCAATLWPDLCFLPSDLSNPTAPTFSIEIKPKQGVFAPLDQGTEQCLFCLKQDLKLINNSVHERSNYCPLDLFSGLSLGHLLSISVSSYHNLCLLNSDQKRMTAALQGLMSTPQNNFIIYKNGQPIFGPDGLTASLDDSLSEWLQPQRGTSLENRICGMLVDVLTRKMDSVNDTIKEELVWQDDGPPLLCRLANSAARPPYGNSDKQGSRRQCFWGKQNLPHGCVLQKLAAVQSLGVCGQAAAYELYKQELNQGADNYTYVKSIIDAGCSSALSPLQSYLVSALARDCSIMIAFQSAADVSPKGALPEVTDPATGSSYVFQIRLMDLDPKPLSCVEKHHQRNCDIAQARKHFTK